MKFFVYNIAVLKSRKNLRKKKTWARFFKFKNKTLYFCKNKNLKFNPYKFSTVSLFFADMYFS